MDINNNINKFWLAGKFDLIERLMQKSGKTNCKILEIGAADCDNWKILKKYGEVTFYDSDRRMLEFAPVGSIPVIGSAEKLPFEDNSFDLILIFGLLEHLDDEHAALKEIRRVSKNNGCCIFYVPAFQFMYSNHDEAIGHKRRYGYNEFSDILKNYMNIDFISFSNFFLFISLMLLRILK